MQTERSLQEVKGISVACVYGGVSKFDQRKALKKASVIVATPGRLLDFINEGKLDLGQVAYLVLDEADQMLDMGFEKDINLILSYCPPKLHRQTAMFSATWPKGIQKLAASFLSDPIRVSIGSRDLAGNPNVTQIVEVIDSDRRFDRLEALLCNYHADGKNRILVFTLYKKETTWLENSLWNRGWNVASIHSNLSQSQRIKALKAFTTGQVPLLIATDVASRGLDIPSVEYVINFTFPQTIQSYVHRIGRTGRAGAKGISHTFFMLQDKTHAGSLVNILKETKQTIPPQLLQFDCSVKKKQLTLGKIDLQQNKGHITFGDSSSDDESE
jgi:ATP-dependent RNA helicase DBP3